MGAVEQLIDFVTDETDRRKAPPVVSGAMPDTDAHRRPVTCTIEDGVAVVRLDDGKVNVVSHRVIELLHAGLDQYARPRRRRSP